MERQDNSEERSSADLAALNGVASADDPGTEAELRRRVAEIEAGDRAGVSWTELKDTIERE